MPRYDSGDRAMRELTENNITGIAGATFTKFHNYAKSRLKRVSALVVTAGTNATAGVDIYVGTTSVGALTVGTNTAGSVADSGALDVEVPAQGMIDLRGKANSATMVLSFAVALQPAADADFD